MEGGHAGRDVSLVVSEQHDDAIAGLTHQARAPLVVIRKIPPVPRHRRTCRQSRNR